MQDYHVLKMQYHILVIQYHVLLNGEPLEEVDRFKWHRKWQLNR